MTQHDTLTQALQEIAAWNSHTTEFAVDYGSNGVRDFYRNIARAALSAAQPAQAAQAAADARDAAPVGDWTYGLDEERFSGQFSTREEAIQEITEYMQ